MARRCAFVTDRWKRCLCPIEFMKRETESSQLLRGAPRPLALASAGGNAGGVTRGSARRMSSDDDGSVDESDLFGGCTHPPGTCADAGCCVPAMPEISGRSVGNGFANVGTSCCITPVLALECGAQRVEVQLDVVRTSAGESIGKRRYPRADAWISVVAHLTTVLRTRRQGTGQHASLDVADVVQPEHLGGPLFASPYQSHAGGE